MLDLLIIIVLLAMVGIPIILVMHRKKEGETAGIESESTQNQNYVADMEHKPLQKVEKKKEQIHIPRQINLDKISYVPLPPSPPLWEEWKDETDELKSEKDLFQIVDSSGWKLTESRKLEKEEKPETFFKEIRITSKGSLFIDSKGKNGKYPECKSSLMKRNREGSIVREVGRVNISILFYFQN